MSHRKQNYVKKWEQDALHQVGEVKKRQKEHWTGRILYCKRRWFVAKMSPIMKSTHREEWDPPGFYSNHLPKNSISPKNCPGMLLFRIYVRMPQWLTENKKVSRQKRTSKIKKFRTIFCWGIRHNYIYSPPPQNKHWSKQHDVFWLVFWSTFLLALPRQLKTRQVTFWKYFERWFWQHFVPENCKKSRNFSLTCDIFYWSHKVQPTYEKNNQAISRLLRW